MMAATLRTPPALAPDGWRSRPMAQLRAEATGYSKLDRLLPGNGLPVGAVTELLCERNGIGEFGLLMPCISRLTQEGRRVALVAPPYVSYAHGLAGQSVRLKQLVLMSPESSHDALWATEQTLRSNSFSLVIAWPERMGDHDLRRLQLAAESSNSVAVLYRPLRTIEQASPAVLRIAIGLSQNALKLRILKNHGGQPDDIFLPDPQRATGFHEIGTGPA